MKQVTDRRPDGTVEAIYGLDENGKREGTYTAYYETGKVMVEGSCRDGQFVGPVTFYRRDGRQLWHTDDWKAYFNSL